jgi:hypothetical protein
MYITALNYKLYVDACYFRYLLLVTFWLFKNLFAKLALKYSL